MKMVSMLAVDQNTTAIRCMGRTLEELKKAVEVISRSGKAIEKRWGKQPDLEGERKRRERGDMDRGLGVISRTGRQRAVEESGRDEKDRREPERGARDRKRFRTENKGFGNRTC